MAQLKAIVARIQLFFDPSREPLRRKIYGIATVILAMGISVGVITGSDATTITTIVATVLMVPTAEAARRQVTPVADPALDDTPGKHEAPETGVVTANYPPSVPR